MLRRKSILFLPRRVSSCDDTGLTSVLVDKGDAMLGYLERMALQCGASKVFVLSTQTMEWFVERGFNEVPVASLPPSRQALYNTKRKSKIYMKEIDGDRDLDAAELWWSNKC